MTHQSEKKIIDSWLQNAKPWISAVQNNEIESRFLVTNKAIIDAILEKKPTNALDIGCGEGWLTRELNGMGIDVCGIDIAPQLIDEANKKGDGKFLMLAYKDLSQETIKKKFDMAICNFSLLGNTSVANLFQNVSSLLNKNGYFIVQTIHPISKCDDKKYVDGWRKGSWEGFSNSFINPAPWYFRTLETWKMLFQQNGFNIRNIIEPLNPKTKSFASIIFVGELTSQ